MPYRKHFIPLESNPTVFTELAHSLGLSPELEFHDVFSLEEPDLLSLIPRPALALVLVFPTSPNHEADLQQLDRQTPEYSKSGSDEDVVWFKQTIHNACGLYGILHAVTNGAARDFIGQYNSPLVHIHGPNHHKCPDRILQAFLHQSSLSNTWTARPS